MLQLVSKYIVLNYKFSFLSACSQLHNLQAFLNMIYLAGQNPAGHAKNIYRTFSVFLNCSLNTRRKLNKLQIQNCTSSFSESGVTGLETVKMSWHCILAFGVEVCGTPVFSDSSFKISATCVSSVAILLLSN